MTASLTRLDGLRILLTQADPRFQEQLRREVPPGRLARADVDAGFATHLCSPAADCFVGQVFALAGGWVSR